jgi:hypothetical protein
VLSDTIITTNETFNLSIPNSLFQVLQNRADNKHRVCQGGQKAPAFAKAVVYNIMATFGRSSIRGNEYFVGNYTVFLGVGLPAGFTRQLGGIDCR